MITRQELEGHWNQVKGQVQERWGQLTEDELVHARGSADQLVGVIEQKTGESRRVIEDFLEQAIEGGSGTVQQLSEKARAYVDQAGEGLRTQYEHAAERAQAGYAEAEHMVQTRPVESVAVAFGAGILTGVIVGLMLRSR
jgi:uncharacterized protein YjbJ (UPF0337 family)